MTLQQELLDALAGPVLPRLVMHILKSAPTVVFVADEEMMERVYNECIEERRYVSACRVYGRLGLNVCGVPVFIAKAGEEPFA